MNKYVVTVICYRLAKIYVYFNVSMSRT